MAKKTGFAKVIGRSDYVIRVAVNITQGPPFKELVTYLDFSSKKANEKIVLI